jgi:hypothetical protein
VGVLARHLRLASHAAGPPADGGGAAPGLPRRPGQGERLPHHTQRQDLADSHPLHRPEVSRGQLDDILKAAGEREPRGQAGAADGLQVVGSLHQNPLHLLQRQRLGLAERQHPERHQRVSRAQNRRPAISVSAAACRGASCQAQEGQGSGVIAEDEPVEERNGGRRNLSEYVIKNFKVSFRLSFHRGCEHEGQVVLLPVQQVLVLHVPHRCSPSSASRCRL